VADNRCINHLFAVLVIFDQEPEFHDIMECVKER